MNDDRDPIEILDDLLDALQNGRCGICGTSKHQLVRDHDHGSGFVRGLLCSGCNVREGQHGDRCPESTISRCRYCTWRRTPAVAWLGFTATFTSPYLFVDHPRFVPSVAIVERSMADLGRMALVRGELAAERQAAS